ncbi:tetratricopeptide repeat protein [Streptomyces sp. NPDC050549]|uniref:tetratricopeptide repeat protein n=1 Tax=Streptomyces sp. NPDC050549 TaxID=3155406 RepID=UPI00341F7A47
MPDTPPTVAVLTAQPLEYTAERGSALRKKGRMAEAVEAYAKALEVYQEFEDWYWTGKVLYNLALLHGDAGRSPEAHTCFLQSADAFTRANAPTEAAQARARAAEQQ